MMTVVFNFCCVKRITVLLPDNIHKAIKLQAVSQDISLSQLTLDAIRMYLQQEGPSFLDHTDEDL